MTLGVVFTMIQYTGSGPLNVHTNFIAQVRGIGLPIFRSRIRYNATVYGGAGEAGIPVVLFAGSEAITDELVALTNEFLTRIEHPEIAPSVSEEEIVRPEGKVA